MTRLVLQPHQEKPFASLHCLLNDLRQQFRNKRLVGINRYVNKGIGNCIDLNEGTFDHR